MRALGRGTCPKLCLFLELTRGRGPALGWAGSHQRQRVSPSFFLFSLRHSDLGCGAAFALWEKLVFVGKLWRYDSEDTRGAAS